MDYRQRIYERYAEVFKDRTTTFNEAETARWGEGYKFYLRDWLPRDKGAAIADLACGHGNLLYVLKSFGYHNLSGVDASRDQVALAQQIVPDVVLGDVVGFLREKKDTYEALTAFDIIEHLDKDEVLDFLDACYCALKPGGRIILQTPNAANPLVNGIRYGDFTHETCFEEQVLGRLLQLCHFSKVEARELGPVPWGYSLRSTVRYFLWRGIRAGIRLMNTVETGAPGSDVLTRVFLISGQKPG